MTPLERPPCFDAVGIGLAVRDVSVLLDRFPTPDEKLRARDFFEAGGGPVPTALVTMSRLGRHVAFCGVLGQDSVGKWIVEDLRREGLDTSGVLFRKGFRSPTSVILVEGGRRTICEPWQTDLPLTLDELHARGVRVEHCRYLLLDARLPELQTEAARRVRSAGGRVVLDCGHPRPGVDEILRLTDIAILSQSYPRAVHGDGYEPGEFLSNLMDRLPKDGPRIVGLTLGSAGCVVRTPETALLSIPGHPVEALDSTGAGDVFHGAFIHALLSGESPESAARFANAAAALKCLGLTGRFPLPPEKEIRQLARI